MFVPQNLFTIGAIYQGAPGTGKTYSLLSMFQQGRYSAAYIDLKADVESSEDSNELRNALEQARSHDPPPADASEDNANQV